MPAGWRLRLAGGARSCARSARPGFEALGPLNLKNIARPVEALVVRPAATTAKSVEHTLSHGTGEALSLPDKPSIAVLAFTNMSGDPEQEYFSDGIAEDIITELPRSHALFVIARNTSFTFKDQAIDVKQVGRELGVRYVLEGSVRRGGQRVRVTTQLIDAETGKHVWAERYDRDLADVFAVQDEITLAVTRAIGPAISRLERQRALRKPPENLDAWEAYQRALWHQTKGGEADAEKARYFLERAIQLDPLFAAAHAMLAYYHISSLNFGLLPSVQQHVMMGEASARRAIELDVDEPSALCALAWVAFCKGDHDAAVEHAEQAISIDPNLPAPTWRKGLDWHIQDAGTKHVRPA